MNSQGAPVGDRCIRAAVLLIVAAHAIFIIFLTVFLFNHADPMGDGMELVGATAAFMLIFLPLSLPAFFLAKAGRHLLGAALLAGIATFAYAALWFQLLDELGIQKAPWS